MGKTLEEWQAIMDKARAPVQARLDYYEKGVLGLKKHIVDYFFTSQTAIAMAKALAPSTLRAMEACKPDEHQLKARAESMNAQDSSRPASLVRAFDEQLTESGFSIAMENESAESGRKERQDFLRQFSYMLDIFRIYVDVYEKYYYVIYDPFIDTVFYETQKAEAIGLSEKVAYCTTEKELRGLREEIKAVKKIIKDELVTLHYKKSLYSDRVSANMAYFDVSLLAGEACLNSCYKEFPGSLLYDLAKKACFDFSLTWQNLLKEVSTSLFNNHFDYVSNGIKIAHDYEKTLCKEVEIFHQQIMEHHINYCLAYIESISTTLNSALTAIFSQAVRYDISIGNLTNKFGFFPSDSSFQSYFAALVDSGSSFASRSSSYAIEEGQTDNTLS